MSHVAWIFLFWIISVIVGCEGHCDNELGMKNKRIPDESITASSKKSDQHSPSFARVDGRRAWCSKPDDKSPYIQIELDEPKLITAITTQGSRSDLSWSRKYQVKYLDKGSWKSYKGEFRGNQNSGALRRNKLTPAIRTQSIRIYPKEPYSVMLDTTEPIPCCLRLELHGCSASEIVCQDPGDIANGNKQIFRRNDDEDYVAVGYGAEYNCFPGYNMEGSKYLTCTRSGQWDQDKPKCVLPSCDSPKLPDNSEIRGSKKDSYQYSDKVHLKCKTGYFSIGFGLMTCGSQGWTSRSFTCNPKSCGDPGDLQNGKLLSYNFTFKSKVYFECDRGYKLVGDKYRQCQANEKWSGRQPKCEHSSSCSNDMQCVCDGDCGYSWVPKGDGCSNYTVLNGPDRAQGYTFQNILTCDNDLTTGWYRFQGDAGNRMPEKCVPQNRCGTRYPGWLSGTHPTVAEGVVSREVHYHGWGNCSYWRNVIKVKNCSSYYLYELQKPPACDLRYCGNAGPGDECKYYSVLSRADRAQGNRVESNICDNNLVTGWYRFQGAAGDMMSNKCVLNYRCGTAYPGWLEGAHPTLAEGVVTRKVCYSSGDHCCWWDDIIKVKNCGSFYVYELKKPVSCPFRFCGNADDVDGCKNYTILSEADRAQRNTLQNDVKRCDNKLKPGWYRFQGAAGDGMPEKCVPTYRCGTALPGWLDGTHPTAAEGAVARRVCFHGSDKWRPNEDCCYYDNMIKVKNCNSYYVYELQEVHGPYSFSCRRYCGNG